MRTPSFVLQVYSPRKIGFNSFPTMAQHIVWTMLPNENGKVNKASPWEGTKNLTYFAYSIYFAYQFLVS
jgi:hypothetical protein